MISLRWELWVNVPVAIFLGTVDCGPHICSSSLLSQYVYLYYPLTKKQIAVINKGTVAHPLQGKADSAYQDLEPSLNENASSEKLYL